MTADSKDDSARAIANEVIKKVYPFVAESVKFMREIAPLALGILECCLYANVFTGTLATVITLLPPAIKCVSMGSELIAKSYLKSLHEDSSNQKNENESTVPSKKL